MSTPFNSKVRKIRMSRKEEQDKLQIKNYKTPDTARVGRFSEEFEREV